jgi:hypothetical protein
MLNLLLAEDSGKLRHALQVGLEGTGVVRVVCEVATGKQGRDVQAHDSTSS